MYEVMITEFLLKFCLEILYCGQGESQHKAMCNENHGEFGFSFSHTEDCNVL